MKKHKYFYGIKIKDSNKEIILNSTNELDQYLDLLLVSYSIDFYYESIQEKLNLLKDFINYSEYKRCSN